MESSAAPRRIIQLLDYDRPKGGSFIAMIRAILKEGSDRGWKPGVIAFSSAGEAPWIEELKRDGVEVHLAPEELRGRYKRLGRG